MTDPKAPVLIELEDEAQIASPADAPPVEDDLPLDLPAKSAMEMAIAFGGQRRSALGRWFLRLFSAVVAFAVGLWAWDWVTALIARSPLLGSIAIGLVGVTALLALLIALREISAIGRLRRIDQLRHSAETAADKNDLPAARQVQARLLGLYAGRPELDWARANLSEAAGDAMDATDLLDHLDHHLMTPLDAAAMGQIERASRQVATATAVLPLTMADVAIALVSNLRMIRQIAEIYGGKSGTFGNWRLARTVMAHIVATGAVAIGDDLIGSLAGGGLVSKLSRRFGEGVINGALTARVGIAAMDVCRPLPYRTNRRPSVSRVTAQALAGLFNRKGNTGAD